ncbi:MAG: arsenosugar biosynthesis radical SAM protein ArsS [Bacteroidetes bacterium]|nr:arsenosugar biosynthesis radical SAM protein ArsS [Bacteroidota bacterium]
MKQNTGKTRTQFSDAKYDFTGILQNHHLDLAPTTIDTLQVNITKLCNQACLHCHVEASPKRTEQMDLRTVDQCLRVLEANPAIRTLDLTGGAPELNPHFDYLVTRARALGTHVMVRHNLTVTFDGNPRTGESKEYLPEFFAAQKVELICSLPHYQPYFTDRQRGKGVFEKSIDGLRLLNARGYGAEDGELLLDLVYNPNGTFLPGDQRQLEMDFKRELHDRYGIVFSQLFTITNMPIHRFRDQLERNGTYDEYMQKLMTSFNPTAAENVMCRNILSVGYDGTLYDCDFNQMLELPVDERYPRSIFDFDFHRLRVRPIVFGSHCFGCTAGSGSSCGGALDE